MNTIPIKSAAENWEAFKSQVNPSKEDATKMQMAYYAGFATCLDTTTALADLSEVEAVRKLEELHREMRIYARVLSASLRGGK